ncbi:MAG: nitroreductase family protein [Planctomycetes bacterium]|nr:nitroreductase family protein [Planctomycetota bacterium]MCB9825908.1 nitroreductase family protein [Planctomycetota bacterium]MCB9829948.1 nitroreductase family protein [Planctomycetota bacterium]MCB9900712.1 nitroreductase family protein [Planctomycetota bacterium]
MDGEGTAGRPGTERTSPRFVPLPAYPTWDDATRAARARAFLATMATRRTVRTFAPDPVPDEVLLPCLEAAGTAPSGAHQQPWHFVVIRDADTKRRIREAAEREEEAFYEGRAPDTWLEALAPLGTDAHKPFLEIAPVLVAVFEESWVAGPDGARQPRYYSKESVGLATGLLLAALHHAGLATLTHTPSPMGFLRDILGRPAGEKAFVLLVVGHPAPDTQVPDLVRKPLDAFVHEPPAS